MHTRAGRFAWAGPSPAWPGTAGGGRPAVAPPLACAPPAWRAASAAGRGSEAKCACDGYAFCLYSLLFPTQLVVSHTPFPGCSIAWSHHWLCASARSLSAHPHRPHKPCQHPPACSSAPAGPPPQIAPAFAGGTPPRWRARRRGARPAGGRPGHRGGAARCTCDSGWCANIHMACSITSLLPCRLDIAASGQCTVKSKHLFACPHGQKQHMRHTHCPSSLPLTLSRICTSLLVIISARISSCRVRRSSRHSVRAPPPAQHAAGPAAPPPPPLHAPPPPAAP